MINKGLFSSFFIERIRDKVSLDDLAIGRMATLTQTWKTCDRTNTDGVWNTFLKQALSYLQFVPANTPLSPGVYKLYEDWGFSNCISVVYLIEPDADVDDMVIGRFWPAKLLVRLKEFDLNWGILTDGSRWRLYSTKSSRPYEDYVELELAKSLERSDEKEYGLFESFFHKDAFIPKIEDKPKQKGEKESASTLLKCQLDQYRKDSERVLDEFVKKPLLYQIDEVLQYLCNGFIFDTPSKGEEYTEEERKEIFENSVKLLYRCLFIFYAEARKLLPSEAEKTEAYERHSLESLCHEAHEFQWGKRTDTEGHDLYMQFKGLINAVNEGDPEYGIMGYNGGLFDDTKERFLGEHRLRNDFFSRALYLLFYVEPQDRDLDKECKIPYGDLEVRHLGELYENILEYTVLLADADRIRRRTKKGVEIILVSETVKQKGDTSIIKGDVYFGESALERKQTGSYYTPEPIVQFLNNKAVIEPLKEKFNEEYRSRFDQFLEQANSGYEDVIKRGASRSALALIKRFVDEVILEFKVCDPAMGSGHFLVDAANQMAGLVVELLAELPEMDGATDNTRSNPNYWRRLITRHCLYGVDLNPLAVDLAKLSLWLNCFAIDHKLTFLDHHLRCGNSLIGLESLDQLRSIPARRKEHEKKTFQQKLPNFENLLEIYTQLIKIIKKIESIDEDNLEQQKDSYREFHGLVEAKLSPLADLFTGYLINAKLSKEHYFKLFDYLSVNKEKKIELIPHLHEIFNSIRTLKTRHKFFHWPFEFSDIFIHNEKRGFDATIGNPPWETIRPNSQEFFSNYDRDFRKYGKQEAIKISEVLMSKNPLIKKKWDENCLFFEEQRIYFREPIVFDAHGKGDINTYKLFLERYFDLIRKKGNIGIVVPSGLYADQGCNQLRILFFKNSRIKFFYSFENRWPTVFNGVDGRFKFVLFGTNKGDCTSEFNCSFVQHNPERLPFIDRRAIRLNLDLIKKFSPKYLTILEFNNQKDIDIANKIYSDNPPLNSPGLNNRNVQIIREFDMSMHSHLFKTEYKEGRYPLYEGGMFWQYDGFFREPRYFLDEIDVRNNLPFRFTNPRWQTCDDYKLVFRAIAASTNERTLISAIIPKNVVCNHNVSIVVTKNLSLNPYQEMFFIMGVSNSFVLDWILRIRGSTYLRFELLRDLPYPSKNYNIMITDGIIARSAQLLCTIDKYSDLWEKVFCEEWRNTEIWYPKSRVLFDSYGPQHEREIRKGIAEKAKSFSATWTLNYGACDYSIEKRDVGNGAQLRAEIDAYVAHLYGLERDEFSYILDTFPVLKRKEEATFGEFMSKRKCLEEYDRIASIL